MEKEFLWTEKYRPHKVSDCVLPDRLKNTFQEYVNRKEVPNMMFSGGPGIGKTTLAMALCDEIGLDYILINASNERGIGTLRDKIVNFASTMSLVGGRKVIILDEADYLTAEAQAALRGTVEEFSNNCTFILTCNFKAKLIDAINSRMVSVDFTLANSEKQGMATAFFKRLKQILVTEEVEFDAAILARIISMYFPDYRKCLGELQRLSVFGKIDESTMQYVSDVKNLKDLMAFLKDKNFKEMRKWVIDNSDVDQSKIYRKVYDSLSDYLESSSIPQAVIILAKYQYQGGFVADAEINLVACMTEIMVECAFK